MTDDTKALLAELDGLATGGAGYCIAVKRAAACIRADQDRIRELEAEKKTLGDAADFYAKACTVDNDERLKAEARAQAADAKVAKICRRAEKLSEAEAAYRRAHDLHGGGDMRTGRAWDRMRMAGDQFRAALAATQASEATPNEPECSSDHCPECGEEVLYPHEHMIDVTSKPSSVWSCTKEPEREQQAKPQSCNICWDSREITHTGGPGYESLTYTRTCPACRDTEAKPPECLLCDDTGKQGAPHKTGPWMASSGNLVGQYYSRDCPNGCKGTGEAVGIPMVTCPQCDGVGELIYMTGTKKEQLACINCEGFGQVPGAPS